MKNTLIINEPSDVKPPHKKITRTSWLAGKQDAEKSGWHLTNLRASEHDISRLWTDPKTGATLKAEVRVTDDSPDHGDIVFITEIVTVMYLSETGKWETVELLVPRVEVQNENWEFKKFEAVVSDLMKPQCPVRLLKLKEESIRNL